MATVSDVSTLTELDALLAGSRSRPVLLFKHSSRCHASTLAHRELLRFAETVDPGRVTLARILVVEQRDVSSAIASRLGVRHESPQAILVVDGGAVWDASHGELSAERLAEAVAGVAR